MKRSQSYHAGRTSDHPGELAGRAKNPLNGLLLSLAFISYLLGDLRAAIVIAIMVVLAIGTVFIQEHRSNDAAAKLRAMVKHTASVRQRGLPGGGESAFSATGINDSPALKAADVGISVDTAVDIAREPADIILLYKAGQARPLSRRRLSFAPSASFCPIRG